MAQRASIKIDKRSATGKWAMRRMRAEGVLPGIVYGHGEAAVPVQLAAADLLGLVKHGARLVDLIGEGQPETALIRELQWDVYGTNILHVDFARVAADERIRIEVKITLRGTAPGVEEGGVLNHLMHNVEIECLATEIPDEIKVDVRGLHLEQSLKVSDLVVPPGVKVLADADVVVVQVAKKIEEVVAAPAEGEVVAAVEPEIVGRRVAEEPPAEEEKKKDEKKK